MSNWKIISRISRIKKNTKGELRIQIGLQRRMQLTDVDQSPGAQQATGHRWQPWRKFRPQRATRESKGAIFWLFATIV